MESTSNFQGQGKERQKQKQKKRKQKHRKDEEMRIIRDRGTLRNIENSIQFGDFIKLQESEDEDLKSEDDSSQHKPSNSGEEEQSQDDDDEDELNDWNHDQDSFLLSQYTEFKRDPGLQAFDGIDLRHSQDLQENEAEEERKSLELAMRLNPDLRDFLIEEKKRRELLGLASDEEENDSESDGSISNDQDDSTSASQDEDADDEDADDDPVIDFADPEWETKAIGDRDSRRGINFADQQRPREEDSGNDALVYDSNSEDELDVLHDCESSEEQPLTQRQTSNTEQDGSSEARKRTMGCGFDGSGPFSIFLERTRTDSKVKEPALSSRSAAEDAISTNQEQRRVEDFAIGPSTSQYDYIPSQWKQKRENIQILLDSNSLDGSMIPYDIPGLAESLTDESSKRLLPVPKATNRSTSRSESCNEASRPSILTTISPTSISPPRIGSERAEKSMKSSQMRHSASTATASRTSSAATPCRTFDVSRSTFDSKEKDHSTPSEQLQQVAIPSEISHAASLAFSSPGRLSPNPTSDRLMRSSSLASTSNSTASTRSSHTSTSTSISASASSTGRKRDDLSSQSKARSGKHSLAPAERSTNPTSTPKKVMTLVGVGTSSSRTTSSRAKQESKERELGTSPKTPVRSRVKSKTVSRLPGTNKFKSGTFPTPSSQKDITPTIKRKRKLIVEDEDDVDQAHQGAMQGVSRSGLIGTSPCGRANDTGDNHSGGKCSKTFCFNCMSMEEGLE